MTQSTVVGQQVGAGGVIQVMPGEGEAAEGVVVALHAHLVAVIDRGDAKHRKLQSRGHAEQFKGLLFPCGRQGGVRQLVIGAL